jgi:hypothetical protein
VELSPPPRPRRAKVELRLTLLVLHSSSGEVALMRRGRGLLRNTTGLPILLPELAEAARQYLEARGARPQAARTEVTHSITHHAISAAVWTVSLPSALAEEFTRDVLQTDEIEWCPPEKAPRSVASSLDRKALLAVAELQ